MIITYKGLPFEFEYKTDEDGYSDWWIMYEDGSGRYASQEEVLLMETLQEEAAKQKTSVGCGWVCPKCYRGNSPYNPTCLCTPMVATSCIP